MKDEMMPLRVDRGIVKIEGDEIYLLDRAPKGHWRCYQGVRQWCRP